jgi:hypothetical protein
LRAQRSDWLDDLPSGKESHCLKPRGDSAADILAGKAAGTRTALFMPDDHRRFHDGDRLRATNPDFIFREHSELSGLLGLSLRTRDS